MATDLQAHANLRNSDLVFLRWLALVWVIWYCYTGSGGPQELVSRLLPIALILQILFMYQKDFLYKWLPAIVNHVLVAVYIGICVYAFVYFAMYYEDIAIWRQGSYTTQDFVVGLLMFLLVKLSCGSPWFRFSGSMSCSCSTRSSDF